jgi:autotransporter translocation and assembly factor TamB
MRVFNRKALRRLRIALAIVLLPPLLAYAALHTDPGRRFATAQSSRLLENLLGERAIVEGLDGWVPFNFSVDRVSLERNGIPWLDVEGVIVKLRPNALARGRAEFSEIAVRRVALDTSMQPPSEETSYSLPSIPNLPQRIQFEAARIEEFAWMHTDGEPPLRLAAEAAYIPVSGAWQVQGDVVELDRDSLRAAFELAQTRNGLRISVDVFDESMLAETLGIDGPFTLEVRGDGPPNDWRGTLLARVQDDTLADAELTVLGDAPLRFQLTGSLHPTLLRIESPVPAWLDTEWRLNGVGSLAEDGLFQLDTFALESEAGGLDADGSLHVETFEHDFRLTARAHDVYSIPGLPETLADTPLRIELAAVGSEAKSQVHVDLNTTGDGPAATFQTALTWGESLEWRDARFEAERIGALLPEAARAWIGDTLAFATDGAWQFEAQRLDATVAEVRTTYLEATGNVAWQPADERLAARLESRLTIAESQALAADLPVWASTKIVLRVDGTPDATQAVLTVVDLTGGAQDFGFRMAALEITANAAAPLTRLAETDIDVGGTTNGIALARDGDNLLSDTSIQLNARIENVDTITLDLLRILEGAHSVEAAGAWKSGETWHAELSVASPQLADLTKLVNLDYGGALTIEGRFNGDADFTRTEGVVDARLENPIGLPKSVAPVFDGQTTLNADFVWQDALELRAARLNNDNVHVQAEGRVDFAADRIDLNADATLNDVGLLLPSEARATGRVVANASISGPLDTLELATRIESSNLAAYDAELTDVLATIDGMLDANGQSFEAALQTTYLERIVTARGNFRLAENFIELRDARLESGDDWITARATLNTEAERLDADVQLHVAEAAVYAQESLASLTAALDGEFRVRGEGKRYESDGTLNFAGVRWNELYVESGAVNWDGAWEDGQIRGDLNADMVNADWPGTAGGQVRVAAEGLGSDLRVAATASGTTFDNNPWSLDLGTDWSPESERLLLNRIDAKLSDETARLEAPAELTYAGKSIRLSPITLVFNEGRIAAEAGLTPDGIDARANWSAVPLRWIQIATGVPFQGTSSGDLAFAGNERVTGRLSAEVSGLRAGLHTQTNAQPTAGRLVANLTNDGLNASLRLDTGSTQFLEASGRAALTVTTSPFAAEIPDESPVEGHVQARIDLNWVEGLLGSEKHQMTGRLDSGVRFTGAFAQPAFNGDVTLDGVAYQFTDTGTRIDELTGGIRFDNDSILIENLRGRARRSGELNVDGRIGLDALNDFPIDLRMSLADFRLLDRDDLVADADGELTVTGNLFAPTVAGRLDMNDTVLVVTPSLVSGATVLEVTEVNLPADMRRRQTAAPDGAGPDVTLDILVAFPYRVRVLATDLRSDWQGELRVVGTLDDPRIDGALDIRSGRLDLIGRRFDFEEGGILRFDRASPINEPFRQYRRHDRARRHHGPRHNHRRRSRTRFGTHLGTATAAGRDVRARLLRHHQRRRLSWTGPATGPRRRHLLGQRGRRAPFSARLQAAAFSTTFPSV